MVDPRPSTGRGSAEVAEQADASVSKVYEGPPVRSEQVGSWIQPIGLNGFESVRRKGPAGRLGPTRSNRGLFDAVRLRSQHRPNILEGCRWLGLGGGPH